MNRADFQKLANDRIADAKAMLAAKRWAAAYYLAGYAVECAFKACILVRLDESPELVFVDRRFSEKCWTHDLTQLRELAGLTMIFGVDSAADPGLYSNWSAVKEWNESSRYQTRTKAQAESLFDAITDKKHGVLPWLKQRW